MTTAHEQVAATPADLLRAAEVHGADSWLTRYGPTALALTRTGGHLGPVLFDLPGGPVAPYSLAPWRPDEAPEAAPIEQILRGDFFCLPFAQNAGYPIHGYPANREWVLTSFLPGELNLEMSGDDGLEITKRIVLEPASPVVYQEHVIRGLSGVFNYGHHAILQFPEEEGSGRIATSAFRYAATAPMPFAGSEEGTRSILAADQRIEDLHAVPLADGGAIDLTRYPTPAGHEDLIMLSAEPAPFAWTAVTFARFVWFALKDPAVLPSTLFWITNAGRSAPPWNGRHGARLGLEEVCGYFGDGREVCAEDRLAAEGVVTGRRFVPDEPLAVRMIQGVAPVDGAAFGQVQAITPTPDGKGIEIRGEGGEPVRVALAPGFLSDGQVGDNA